MKPDVTDEMVSLVYGRVDFINHGDDGIREGLADALDLVSNCLACPRGCGSCSRDDSDCECYEHQHPQDKAEATIRYLVELIESGTTVNVPDMRGRVLAQGWVI